MIECGCFSLKEISGFFLSVTIPPFKLYIHSKRCVILVRNTLYSLNYLPALNLMFLYDSNSVFFSLQLWSLEGCRKNRESEWRMRRTTSNSHAWTGTIPRVECHLATTTISFLCKIETMLYPSNPLISSNNTVSKQPHVANQQQKSKQQYCI